MMGRQQLEHRAVAFVAKRRRSRIMTAGARLARAYLTCYGNVLYEPDLNGESRALELLGRGGVRCVFDVGANVGGWVLAARDAIPSVEVHAFEIVPDTVAELRDRVGGLPGVTVNPYGLADVDDEIEITYFPGFSAGSGIDPFAHDQASERRTARVRRGDDYCAEAGVERIGLLKLDVEGAEERVLTGFERMLGEGRIDAIQFEYGMVNAQSKWLLRDAYQLLGGHGFALGKIYPTYVDFRDYDVARDEDLRGPNYLAVRRDRPDLIDLLA